MRESRRRLLMTFVGVAGVLAAGPALSRLEGQTRQAPRAKPYPTGAIPTLLRSGRSPASWTQRQSSGPTSKSSKRTSPSSMKWFPNLKSRSRKQTQLPFSPSPLSRKPSRSKSWRNRSKDSQKASASIVLKISPERKELPKTCLWSDSDFALHVYQDCVSLNESKRRGKIQGTTERGT